MTVQRAARGSAASDHLDLLRGLAAVAVLVGNGRTLFFVDHAALGPTGLAIDLWYFASGLGHQAVMVFFVLSGFFVGGAAVESLPRWSWGDYLLARATRLYPVLLVGLLSTAVWDHLGIGINAALYAGAHEMSTLQEPVAEHLGLLTLLGNLAFLQTLAVPTYGSNGALWSLCNELWYYLLFPLLLGAIAPRRSALRLAGALLCAVLLATVFRSLAFYFLVWLMGVAVAVLPAGRAERPAAARAVALIALLGLLLALAAARLRPGEGWGDLAIGAATALLIWSLLRAGAALPSPPRYARLARTLAGCSFTLYVTHFPVLVFARAAGGALAPLPASPRGIAMFALIAAAVGLYGWAIAQFVEPQTARLRRALARPPAVALAARPTAG